MAAGISTGDGDNLSPRPPPLDEEPEPVVKTVGIEVDGTTTLPTGGGGGLVEPPETRNLGLPETNTLSGSQRGLTRRKNLKSLPQKKIASFPNCVVPGKVTAA